MHNNDAHNYIFFSRILLLMYNKNWYFIIYF